MRTLLSLPILLASALSSAFVQARPVQVTISCACSSNRSISDRESGYAWSSTNGQPAIGNVVAQRFRQRNPFSAGWSHLSRNEIQRSLGVRTRLWIDSNQRSSRSRKQGFAYCTGATSIRTQQSNWRRCTRTMDAAAGSSLCTREHERQVPEPAKWQQFCCFVVEAQCRDSAGELDRMADGWSRGLLIRWRW